MLLYIEAHPELVRLSLAMAGLGIINSILFAIF